MKYLNTKPQSIWDNINDIFYFYPKVIKQAWPLILLTSALHLFYPLVIMLNTYVGLAISVGCTLLVWFLFAAIIYRCYHYMQNHEISYSMMWRHARRRYIAVLAGNVIFIAIFALAGFLQAALLSAAEVINLEYELAFFAAAFNIFLFFSIYFAVPIIVVDNLGFFAAFEKSAKLVWGNWWRTFIPGIMVLILMAAATVVAVLATGHNRIFLFTLATFLFNLLFYPLIVTYTLVLLNDLKIRRQIKQKVVES